MLLLPLPPSLPAPSPGSQTLRRLSFTDGISRDTRFLLQGPSAVHKPTVFTDVCRVPRTAHTRDDWLHPLLLQGPTYCPHTDHLHRRDDWLHPLLLHEPAAAHTLTSFTDGTVPYPLALLKVRCPQTNLLHKRDISLPLAQTPLPRN